MAINQNSQINQKNYFNIINEYMVYFFKLLNFRILIRSQSNLFKFKKIYKKLY